MERRVDLVPVAHLDRQREVGAGLPGAPDRPRDPSRRGDVVLLDEDRVVQPGAVVDAAAVGHRPLLKPPEPGVVLRVSRICAVPPASRTARTTRAVAVATPESRPRKFRAVRSVGDFAASCCSTSAASWAIGVFFSWEAVGAGFGRSSSALVIVGLRCGTGAGDDRLPTTFRFHLGGM